MGTAGWSIWGAIGERVRVCCDGLRLSDREIPWQPGALHHLHGVRRDSLAPRPQSRSRHSARHRVCQRWRPGRSVFRARIRLRDELGCSGKSVATQIHGRRAGMIRMAREVEAKASLPHDAVTAATERPSDSSSGPCSMCISTKPMASGSSAALSIRAGSSPKARMASSSVMPSASFRASSAGSKRPATARLPIKGTPKRTPSSSENAMTSMGSSRSSCAFGRAQGRARRRERHRTRPRWARSRYGSQERVARPREPGGCQSPRRFPVASVETVMPSECMRLRKSA